MTTMELPPAATLEGREDLSRPTCVFTASLMYRLASECGWRAPTACVVAGALPSDCRLPE